MTTYELSLKVPFGPMHKTSSGLIWCGSDQIDHRTPAILGPRYQVYHLDLIALLNREAPISSEAVRIIEPNGSLISDKHVIPAAGISIEYTQRDKGTLPMAFALTYKGKLVYPLVISADAAPIVRQAFPDIACECVPMLLAGERVF